MSILGKYVKQPVEVEVYSIQFVDDMAATDEITSAWQIIAPSTLAAWDQVVQSAPYMALASDDQRILVSTASITLPTGVADGYRLCVGNQSQVSAITVGSFNVPARGAIVVTRKSGAWAVEASTNAVLIDAARDQRVRTFVSGGIVNLTYKVQVLVNTTEGRTLQDEFLVRIKES